MEVASAFVSLVPSFKGGASKIGQELGGPIAKAGEEGGKKFGERFLGSFTPSLKGLAGPLAGVFAAGKIKDFLGDAIAQASDLNEAGTALKQVFGGGTQTVLDFAGKGAKALGQSKLAVEEAATKFGVYGKAAGLAGAENAKFSTQLLGLSTDLASFYNTSPEQAAEAIAAGLRGESEPLRQYGVLLDDATLRQKALKLGLIQTTSQALTPQQKVLAAQAAILEQTKVAQGDFARTSGGLANQQRILSAQFTDVKAKLGAQLLPVAQTFFSFLTSTALPAVTTIGSAFGTVAGFVSSNATAFGVLAIGVGAVAAITAAHTVILAANSGALAAWFAQTVVVRAATAAWAAVQAVLNAVLAANPIFLVVAALVALVAGLVIAYKKSDTFRAIVNAAFDTVRTVVLGVLDAVTGAVKAAFGFITSAASNVLGFLRANWPLLLGILTGPIGLAVVAITKNWDTIKAGVAALKDAVVAKFGEVVSFVASVPGKILSALGNVGSLLLGVGRDIVQGLINGIRNMAGAVTDALVGLLPGPLKKFAGALGINSPSKKFMEFGAFVGQGFALGIDSTQARVDASVRGMAATAIRTPSLAGVPVGGPSGAGGGYGGPRTLVVVDADGQLIGRMRVEADGRIASSLGGIKQAARAR